MKEVLLGFSAGIDSCACANFLKNEGYKVTALYIDTLGDALLLEGVRQKARELDLELVVEDRVEQFKSDIIDYFTTSYLQGRTPAPCSQCNALIKWASLAELSESLGIEKIATGHYFALDNFNDKYYVRRGVDSVKDQSYYLWNIPMDLRPRIITPMSDKIKSELNRTGVKESMGVCFLRGQSYVQFLKSCCHGQICPGEIVNNNGEVIGTHEGFPFYTIGQKKGLTIEDKSKKYCITNIDAKNNILQVGEDKDLFYNNLEVKNFSVVDMGELTHSADCQVVIRGIGRNPEGFAKINLCSDTLRIQTDNPLWAPALGQPVVFYRDNRVLGGGILEKYY